METEARHERVPTANPAGIPRRRERRPTPKGRRPGSRSVKNSWTKLLDNSAELASLVFDGVTGALIHVVAHVARAVPDSPTGLLGMIILLSPLMLLLGNKEQVAQNLCFGCLAIFALIAVGLIIVILKAQGGNNEWLRQNQRSRLEAIRVEPIRRS